METSGSHSVQPPVNISKMETPQTLWAPVPVLDHSHGDDFFPLCLTRISLGAICALCPLLCISENNLAPSYLQWLFG